MPTFMQCNEKSFAKFLMFGNFSIIFMNLIHVTDCNEQQREVTNKWHFYYSWLVLLTFNAMTDSLCVPISFLASLSISLTPYSIVRDFWPFLINSQSMNCIKGGVIWEGIFNLVSSSKKMNVNNDTHFFNLRYKVEG